LVGRLSSRVSDLRSNIEEDLKTLYPIVSRQNFEELVVAHKLEELEVDPLIDLESAEFESEEYSKLRKYVRDNESRLPDIRLVDKHVYKRTEFPNGDHERETFKWKLWVPKTLVEGLIKTAHCPPTKSHGGLAKTLERLRTNFYWPNITVDLKDFIASCDVCRQSKGPNTTLRPPMTAQYTVQRPFQKLYIDLLGPYPRSKQGNIGILIVLDHLTKFVLLKTIKKFTSEPICNFLTEYVFSIFELLRL
ncbi:uncharacterized protein LOC118732824, partial [Rhagoletis pomonella]|uniref:uncharacterized protein LOC118732824 n=1 Tax=Rhagoletis pomonella TaxID=28610 RepID=UPI00178562A8